MSGNRQSVNRQNKRQDPIGACPAIVRNDGMTEGGLQPDGPKSIDSRGRWMVAVGPNSLVCDTIVEDDGPTAVSN